MHCQSGIEKKWILGERRRGEKRKWKMVGGSMERQSMEGTMGSGLSGLSGGNVEDGSYQSYTFDFVKL